MNYKVHEKYMRIILKEIFTNKLWDLLAFKGGTLVYLTHNLDRFSTDIDIDIIDIEKEELIVQEIREILTKVGEIKNETLGKNLHRRIFRYDERSMNIKVELNKRIRENNTYEYKTIDGVKLQCMKKDSIFANKLVALSERIANRDLYDVNFFFKNNFPINKNLIIERTGLPIDVFLKNIIKELQARYTGNSILAWLWEVLSDKQKAWVKAYLLIETIGQINNYLSLQN